ncbi:hypothetical protein EDB89DRAFT_1006345 [Lactarius sanguifluus]|nr:hypothetical protein EDB89DRAFT_1006345 [Lactarius sanguifluus]
MQANTPMNVSDGASSLTAEMYLSVLRAWMKNLWHFTREYNERGNSTPLPSSIRIAFTNPEMTCRLRKQHDLAVRVIGRCVETLVVNKLAADIKSRRVPVKDDELACLSTILGTKSDDVVLLLSHPGAIEFTNMVFLALDDFDTASAKVPLYVLDVVQQTSSALSLDLPLELNAKMRLNQANILLNVSDGTSSLAVGVYTSVLRIWMKNLWHFTRGYNERGNSLPLPSYVYIAFTNPEMTRRICEERDLAVHVIGRCVEALVINKLAADINSREFPVSNDELACLSVILGTKSRDVTLLLSCPCAIEFTNMVFLALDDFDSSTPGTVPPYVLDVFQQTSSALSRALPPELNSKMRLNQTDTLMDVPDGTSLTAEIHMSILRGWMKNLWHFARECNEYGSSVPLPSYISIAFTNPEMTQSHTRGT